MIPLSDLERPRRPPVVTRALILANVAVFVYVLSLTPLAVGAFYERWSFDLSRSTAATLVTHQFLHAGWLHLLGNLLYLWVFGPGVEGRMGPARALVFYLLVGALAAIAQGLAGPGPMVGASGAIAGILGAHLVLSPRARIRTLVFLGIFITVVTLPAIVVIGEWIVIQVIAGFGEVRVAPHNAAATVAYVAHIAGFASGIVLVRAFSDGRR